MATRRPGIHRQVNGTAKTSTRKPAHGRRRKATVQAVQSRDRIQSDGSEIREEHCIDGLKLICPVNFSPEDSLQGRDVALADGLIYLAHAIITRRATAPRCVRKGFVPLQGAILKQILGHRKWPRVKTAALTIGLVECDGSYRVGDKSLGYRLQEPYQSANWEWRPIRDRRLAERIECWRENDRRREWERLKAGKRPVPYESVAHLWRNLQRVQIDDAIDGPLSRESTLAVDLLRQGAWRIDVDDFGRVHTNITNLKKTLRKCLSVDGSRLVNCDVANSQPLFLGMILVKALEDKPEANQRERRQSKRHEERQTRGRREGRRGEGTLCGALLARRLCGALSGSSHELRQFLTICERGAFYRHVLSHLEADLEYDVLKKRVLAALYDQPWHRNRVQDALRQAFPGVMAALTEIKRDDYRRAAHLAQRIESDFIIGRCVGRLAREQPDLFATSLHDSVMTTAGDEGMVRQIMFDEFEKVGISPTIHVEVC